MTLTEFREIQARAKHFTDASEEMLTSEDTHCMEDFCMKFVLDGKGEIYKDLNALMFEVGFLTGWGKDDT